MRATVSAQSSEVQLYAQSWVFSMLLHALAVGSTVVFLGDLQLEPQPEPFKWDVVLVEAPQPMPVEQSTSAPSKQAEPIPAQPTPAAQVPVESRPPAEPRPTEPVPVQQVMQAVQSVEKKVVQQEVRQEVQEVKQVKPLAKENPSPAPPVIPTVQPVEIPKEKPKEIVQTAEAYPVPTDQAMQANHGAPSVSRHSEPAVAVAPATPAPAASQHSTESVVPAPVHEQAVDKESQAQETAPPIQEAMLRDTPVRPASVTKSDYGWLAKVLWERVAMLKRYPHVARVNHLEGRVVLRAVIKEDGNLLDLEVAESSGHSVLDEDALEVVRRACPLKLERPLGRSQVVVKVPISYRLQR